MKYILIHIANKYNNFKSLPLNYSCKTRMTKFFITYKYLEKLDISDFTCKIKN